MASHPRPRAASLMSLALSGSAIWTRDDIGWITTSPAIAQLEGRRLRRVDPLESLHESLEGGEATLEHPHVHAQREHDRQREDQELPALVVDRDVESGGLVPLVFTGQGVVFINMWIM